MKTAIRLVLSAAVLLTSVACVPMSFAQDAVRTETVRFSDLKMDTPTGVQTLYGRIHAAAVRVCAQTDPVMRLAAHVCLGKAEARAIQALNLPQLTAYYQGQTGKQPAQPIIAQR